MTIQSELLSLKNGDGLILAESAVQWAKSNPDSALHKSLEWDNSVAGHNWRIWQTRQLIAIHIVDGDNVRRFVSLSVDRQRDGGGYREISDVMKDKSLRDVLLEDALAELDRVQTRYKTVKDLAEVWAAKDSVKGRRRKSSSGPEAPRPTA